MPGAKSLRAMTRLTQSAQLAANFAVVHNAVLAQRHAKAPLILCQQSALAPTDHQIINVF